MQMRLVNHTGFVLDWISSSLTMTAVAQQSLYSPHYLSFFSYYFVALIPYHKSTWLQESHSAQGLPM